MPYYAHAHILGHLGRDVETKSLPSGKQLHEFSVAVSEGSSDKKVTSWYHVKVWGDLIQWKLDALTKGALVMASGRLSIETWENKDGSKGSKTVITADPWNGVNVFGERKESAQPDIVSRPRSSVPAQEIIDDESIPF